MKEKNEFLVSKRYVKEVSAVINCCKCEKLFFACELNDYVSAYVAEHPEATMETLYAEFGSPEQFANGILARDDYAKMLKKAKRKAAFWTCTAVIAVIISALICAVLIKWSLSRGDLQEVDPPEVSYYIEEGSQQ